MIARAPDELRLCMRHVFHFSSSDFASTMNGLNVTWNRKGVVHDLGFFRLHKGRLAAVSRLS